MSIFSKALFFLLFLSGYLSLGATSLHINIVGLRTSAGDFETGGFIADCKVLTDALEEMGHQVYLKPWYGNMQENEQLVDINIFLERINGNYLKLASVNWLIPNPESHNPNHADMEAIDLILCRTHEVERIFKPMPTPTFYLGFTSIDCAASVTKDYSRCLHAPGRSAFKGTSAVFNAWQSDSEMPHLLTIIESRPWMERICSVVVPEKFDQHNFALIKEKLPLDQFRAVQNHCGIHLCPSDTEGFGHYVVEAMSAGVVVLTTDAPPMNEHITDSRCLVPYVASRTRYEATRYFVDAEQLKTKVLYLMSLSREELEQIGKENRLRYMAKTQEFESNLARLINEIFLNKKVSYEH